jgi:ribulose-5-phosphate 4-epimerase/fuculose-1-phosphate aldolase
MVRLCRYTGNMVTASINTVEDIRAERLCDLVLGYRLFASQRWGDLGDGHISARDPERDDCFWLLRLNVSFHDATESDMVLVGPDGRIVEGDGKINQSAYHIHHPIHVARPDIICAAHVHTGWGTPFAAEVRPIEPITQEACLFFENHALFDDEEVQIQDTAGGGRIADSLGDNAAVILRNHGLITVADSVAEAVGLFVILERVAESHMKARDAKPISAEAARYAKQDLNRDGAGAGAFRWLVSRHIQDSGDLG